METQTRAQKKNDFEHENEFDDPQMKAQTHTNTQMVCEWKSQQQPHK